MKELDESELLNVQVTLPDDLFFTLDFVFELRVQKSMESTVKGVALILTLRVEDCASDSNDLALDTEHGQCQWSFV